MSKAVIGVPTPLPEEPTWESVSNRHPAVRRMAVPGGWLYTINHFDNPVVFVPDPGTWRGAL